MCIFSRNADVNTTRIFARRHRFGQYLVYQMQYMSEEDNAMILPLPVNENSPDACQFIDMSDYPQFFVDMEKSFPRYFRATKSIQKTLDVYNIGSYTLSFVPSLDDFNQLDPLFRLPRTVWRHLPREYTDFGFAVCQLHPGKRKIHPIALHFYSDGDLYFPTCHVHDGKSVPKRAHFDHTIYFQNPKHTPKHQPIYNEVKSSKKASEYMDITLSNRAVRPDLFIYKIRLQGKRINCDTRIYV